MKRILITGLNSYVGNSLGKWLENYPEKYSVDFISLRDNKWKERDFSEFDVVFHVAALVHKKEKKNMESLYFQVNRDVTVHLAKKAKQDGVKQFIFMSSISIYGLDGSIHQHVLIEQDTPYNPKSFYGKSKLEAETEIKKLDDEEFKIAIVRAPMIYGPKCPGNYSLLKKIAISTPIFPSLENKRSMIFINNLTEFLRLLIETKENGIFFPQNNEYINTASLVKLIANEHSKKVFLSKTLGNAVKLFSFNRVANKVFGNLVIDPSLSNFKQFNYCLTNFQESIEISEKDREKGEEF